MTSASGTAPTGAELRRGPFSAGERVQLTDPKGRMHTITLAPGKQFHTHRGHLTHDELIGMPDGSTVTNTAGVEYLALRPLLSDYVMSMPRGAAVVYPKDAGQIVTMADMFPGAVVVEAGVGSGALSMSLLRAVGETGHVHSFERREDFAEIAKANARDYFGTDHPAWTVTVGDLVEALPRTVPAGTVDRVVLDMLAPWECLEVVADALAPGRRAHLLRRHRHPAVQGRRGDARPRHLHRAAGLGVARARLAPRGPGGPTPAPDARAHRLPHHDPPPRARASRRRCASAARARATSRRRRRPSRTGRRRPSASASRRRNGCARCAAP